MLCACFAGASSDVGPIAQIEALPGSARKRAVPRIPVWQLVLIGVLLAWIYSSILPGLVRQWWQDPNFSHGFFVPLFSLYLLWRNWPRIIALTPRPSWWGLPLTILGLGVLSVGDLGAELFLSRFSLLVLLAGLIVLLLGWNYFRALLFPLAFLVFMIPIPAIIFNHLTFPLQILASKIAAAILPVFGVPVYREGNVINLPKMALDVAEACSGIRSMVSLLTLAVIYGYLTEARIWVRVVLALISLPIVVIANSLRIVVTGLIVQYWNPAEAEGTPHLLSGGLIFLGALVMLYLFHKLLSLVLDGNGAQGGAVAVVPTTKTGPAQRPSTKVSSPHRFTLIVLLLAVAGSLLRVRGNNEPKVSREGLASFPQQLGTWKGTVIPIPDEDLRILGPGDFLDERYENQGTTEPAVDLLILYFPSQRTGDTIHSPQHCLFGAGWLPVESGVTNLSLPGVAALLVNRYVVAKKGERQLVFYWYLAHGRAVASDYRAKFYLVKDAIRLNRSDGALIRIMTSIPKGESTDSAQHRLSSFAETLVPLLDRYVPR